MMTSLYKEVMATASLLVCLWWVSAPAHACLPPPCNYYFNETDPLRLVDFYSYPCVCVSYSYEICFYGVTLAEGTTHAHYSDENAFGCQDVCVSTMEGEVCKPKCSIGWPGDFISMDEFASRNFACRNRPQFDICCPNLGFVCPHEAIDCAAPRCTPPKTEGCFNCECLPAFPYPPYVFPCPPFIPDCSFYNAYYCCANESACASFGNPDDIDYYFGSSIEHPHFDQCQGMDSSLKCDGILESGENCCPGDCRAEEPPQPGRLANLKPSDILKKFLRN